MKKEILEDVLKYLIPYYRFVINNVLKGNKINVKEIIENGIKTGEVIFNESLKINLKELEKQKGKKWVIALKKQLKIFSETIEKI